ncbi:LysR family transcriptional regulator [Pseudorhodoferax sp. Leaf267]|uniref:LysR family transcriptional regulator n=1 Tax=Pseudorhodoferax sp. Leaf267 TaxID=1736316 RepID=UPI0006F2061B|nr:LysR family transcriptional regulator [Pseudorhodoferax sp. Leaf267]KQP18286.1 LysR family transcriptional regulator [Pseudorhodoferax sp. Leaf267]
MRDLDLVSLRLFVAACDHRNLARAGEQENIGSSAISKRLAQLESALNTPVLQRHRRGVIPTPAGELLLEHARALLAGSDRLARDMAAFGRGIKGQVRVFATVSSIAEFLPDDIASFMSAPENAAIRVDIAEGLSSKMAQTVREGLAPLGVGWDAVDLGELQSRPYRSDHLAIVAHPAHPIAKLRQCAFVETLQYEHVGLPAPTAVHTMLARAAAILGMPLNYRAVVSTFDASLRCVRAGLGIAVVPREVVEPAMRHDAFRVIPLTDAWARRRFIICYKDEATLSPAARMLLEHLERTGRSASEAAEPGPG